MPRDLFAESGIEATPSPRWLMESADAGDLYDNIAKHGDDPYKKLANNIANMDFAGTTSKAVRKPKDLFAESGIAPPRAPRDLFADAGIEATPATLYSNTPVGSDPYRQFAENVSQIDTIGLPKKEEPATWGETLSALPGQIKEDAKAVAGAAVRFAGEARERHPLSFKQTSPILPKQEEELSRALAKTGEEMYSSAQERLAEITPANQSFGQQAVSGAARSLAAMVPGTMASLLTRNPAWLIGGIGAQEGWQSYGEARDAGATPEDSFRYAIRQGLIESGTELIPVKILFKPGTAPFKRLVQGMAAEIPGENIANIAQSVNAWVEGLRDEATVGELLKTIVTKELPLTTASTVIASGAQSATASGIHKAGEIISKDTKSVEEIVKDAADSEAPDDTVYNQNELEGVDGKLGESIRNRLDTIKALEESIAIDKAQATKAAPAPEEITAPEKEAPAKTTREFSSTQTPLPPEVSQNVRQVQKKLIAKEDLYEGEAEANTLAGKNSPHVTVKYGLHTAEPADVAPVMEGVEPIKATIGGIEIFEGNENYDVVVARVESRQLRELNEKIASNLEVTDTHPTYKPHITLAYVNKGAGKKYKDLETGLEGQTVVLNEVEFSPKSGDVTSIPLTGAESALTETPQAKENYTIPVEIPEKSELPVPEGSLPETPAQREYSKKGLKEIEKRAFDTLSAAQDFRKELTFQGFRADELKINPLKNGKYRVYVQRKVIEAAPEVAQQPAEQELIAEPAKKKRMRANIVQAAINGFRRNYKGAQGLDIKVVQSVTELPYEAPENTEGAVHDGSIYLVSDNLPSLTRAHEVILHEAVGHYGLSTMMGDRFAPLLKLAEKSFANELADIARLYKLDLGNESHRLLAAEELIARKAESDPQAGIVRRAIMQVRQWLRQVGIKIKLSDNDIRALLTKAKKNLEKGSSPEGAKVKPEAKLSLEGEGKKSNIRRQAEIAIKSPELTAENLGAPTMTDAEAVAMGKRYYRENMHGKRVHSPAFNEDAEFGSRGLAYLLTRGNEKEVARRMKLLPMVIPIIENQKYIDPVDIRAEGKGHKRYGLTGRFKSGDVVTIVLDEIQKEGKKFLSVFDIGRLKGEKLYKKMDLPIPDGQIVAGGTVSGKQPPLHNSNVTPEPKKGKKKPRPDDVRESLRDALGDEIAGIKAILKRDKKTDITMLEQVAMSPEWMKHPVIKKIVDFAMRRTDEFHRLFNYFDTTDDGKRVSVKIKDLARKGLTRTQFAMGKRSQDYEDLKTVLTWADERKWDEITEKDPDKRAAAIEKKTLDAMRRMGMSDDTIAVWGDMRRGFDKALDELMKPMLELKAEIDKAAQAEKTQPVYPDIGDMNLRDIIKQMGELKGYYAPRKRVGDWAVLARKNGKDYRFHETSERKATKRRRQLIRQGYDVAEIRENDNPAEEVYQELSTVATEQLVQNAIKHAGMDAETSARLMAGILTQSADIIKARGFRAHTISRRDGEVVSGYIEDPMERYARYMTGVAGGIAKADAAKKMTSALMGEFENGERVGGIDSAREPNAYKYATKYIKNQLRNSDKYDAIVAKLKALAVIKYLGFNPRSALVNMTALVTTVPPALHQYATDGKATLRETGFQISRAMKDYGKYMAGKKKGLTTEERLFMDKVREEQYDNPQLTREAMGEMENAFGGAWNKFMNSSMWLFGKTEQFNRGTTLLAGYRLARKHGKNHEQAIEAAHTATDKGHGVYGKATLSIWAQGDGAGERIGQLFSVFQKFGHNYVQMLGDLGVDKKNYKAFMYALLSNGVVAGGEAFLLSKPFFWVMEKIMGALGDDRDPEKMAYDWVREKFGEEVEENTRYGLMSAVPQMMGLPGINIAGSLSVGVGIPKNKFDLLGAPGGVWKDFFDAAEAIERDEYWGAAAKIAPSVIGNPLKAYTEQQRGAYTFYNKPIRNPDGTTYKPSGAEAVAKALGFTSSKRAALGARQWDVKREKKKFADLRSKIYGKYKTWLADDGEDEELWNKILAEIEAYNNQVADNGLPWPFITGKSLIASARGLYRD